MRSNEALVTVRPGASSMAFPPPQLSVHSSLLTLLSMPSAAALSIRMMSSLHCSNRRDMSSRNPGSPPSCHAASVGSRQSGISVPDVEYIPVRNRSASRQSSSSLACASTCFASASTDEHKLSDISLSFFVRPIKAVMRTSTLDSLECSRPSLSFSAPSSDLSLTRASFVSSTACRRFTRCSTSLAFNIPFMRCSKDVTRSDVVFKAAARPSFAISGAAPSTCTVTSGTRDGSANTSAEDVSTSVSTIVRQVRSVDRAARFFRKLSTVCTREVRLCSTSTS
mmetsp:Transcript_51493/g.137418  ORF Transcript_51493/g.137418 Transcript_51493/m.137418 type:complete len:281 (-) Transcript_51493:1029-1871(-)